MRNGPVTLSCPWGHPVGPVGAQTGTWGSWWWQGCSVGCLPTCRWSAGCWLTCCGPCCCFSPADLDCLFLPQLLCEVVSSQDETGTTDGGRKNRRFTLLFPHLGYCKGPFITFPDFGSSFLLRGFRSGAGSPSLFWYLFNTRWLINHYLRSVKKVHRCVMPASLFADLATSRDTDMARSSSRVSVQAAWSPAEDKLSDWLRFRLLLQSILLTSSAHL